MVKEKSKKKPTLILSIFLIRKDEPDLEARIRQHSGLEIRKVKAGGKNIGTLFAKAGIKSIPRWLDMFKGLLDSELKLFNQLTQGILLVKASERYFALVFGHGKSLLPEDSWEENFGLKVTLNAVDRKKIRIIERQSFDALSKIIRTQTIQEGEVDQFGVDVDQDLLRTVVGTPMDESLGKRMTGVDSLHVSVKANIEDIPVLLEKYLSKSKESSYKEKFPWVDRVNEVRSNTLKTELDTQLVAKIVSGDVGAWMAVPEMLQWEEVGGFAYSQATGADTYHDIHVDTFRSSIRPGTKIDIEYLENRKVFCLDVEEEGPIKIWPAYKCFYCEVQLKGNTYLLTNGKWYWINRDFAEEINGFADGLQFHDLGFPTFDDQAAEKTFNEKVGRIETEYAVMDGDLIHYGAKGSSIEFCDLYSKKKKQIVHVKKYAGSSVLSHFFNQGYVSGRSFLELDFRKKVNEKLPETHKLDNIEKEPRTQNYKIVFAVISKQEGARVTFPFFSKINLRNTINELRAYGYEVLLAKIGWLVVKPKKVA